MNQPVNPVSISTDRTCQHRTFSSHDSAEIFYRYWPANEASSINKVCVLFHRGHEHGGRMAHIVDELNMPDTAFFAWDARGLGRSEGERGHALSFAEFARDIDCFINHICDEFHFQTEEIAVIGQSVGAVMLTSWVHDYAPKIRAMVLASPAFKVKLYVPFARQLISLRQSISGNITVNSYVKAHYLTHDPERIQSYNNDPLITRPIASNLLLDLYQTSERCIEDAHAIHTPTLTLISGSDWVVEKQPQYEFMARLGSERKKLIELPGFYHDTLGELERERALTEIRSFLTTQFGEKPSTPDLSSAHLLGQGYQNFAGLTDPVSGPTRYLWQLTKKLIDLGAQLSEGYRLGRDTGFDSGSTLDYVYRNTPTGKGWLGRTIDRSYLNSIGWQGIRQRKVNLEQAINQAIDELFKQEKPVNILDIAAGHGRYILDAIEQRKPDINNLELRDFSDINVTAGQEAIQQRGLDHLATFSKGDAFDKKALTATDPQPTLGIVSGLYELFPDNALLETSLAGLAEAIPQGGFLIYTNQPWHPQQELIARALSSHRDHQPWVMRCRSQAEMDQLVEKAGFEKQQQLIDQWGIFSVSIAKRV